MEKEKKNVCSWCNKEISVSLYSEHQLECELEYSKKNAPSKKPVVKKRLDFSLEDILDKVKKKYDECPSVQCEFCFADMKTSEAYEHRIQCKAKHTNCNNPPPRDRKDPYRPNNQTRECTLCKKWIRVDMLDGHIREHNKMYLPTHGLVSAGNSTDGDMDRCGICNQMFHYKFIGDHMKMCVENSRREKDRLHSISTNQRERKIKLTIKRSDNKECPLCFRWFHDSEIMQHAEKCNGDFGVIEIESDSASNSDTYTDVPSRKRGYEAERSRDGNRMEQKTSGMERAEEEEELIKKPRLEDLTKTASSKEVIIKPFYDIKNEKKNDLKELESKKTMEMVEEIAKECQLPPKLADLQSEFNDNTRKKEEPAKKITEPSKPEIVDVTSIDQEDENPCNVSIAALQNDLFWCALCSTRFKNEDDKKRHYTTCIKKSEKHILQWSGSSQLAKYCVSRYTSIIQDVPIYRRDGNRVILDISKDIFVKKIISMTKDIFIKKMISMKCEGNADFFAVLRDIVLLDITPREAVQISQVDGESSVAYVLSLEKIAMEILRQSQTLRTGYNWLQEEYPCIRKNIYNIIFCQKSEKIKQKNFIFKILEDSILDGNLFLLEKLKSDSFHGGLFRLENIAETAVCYHTGAYSSSSPRVLEFCLSILRECPMSILKDTIGYKNLSALLKDVVAKLIVPT
jgi:hypothetical protein